ncbi:MAG: hypothetical protein LBH66_04910 [Oscillospiraceae bacterium]|nr:hypothetical protein [Oscillospiraceae bacterium]
MRFPDQPFATGDEVVRLQKDGFHFKVLERGTYEVIYQFQIRQDSCMQTSDLPQPLVGLTINGEKQYPPVYAENTSDINSNAGNPIERRLEPGDTLSLEAVATSNSQTLTNYNIMIRRKG